MRTIPIIILLLVCLGCGDATSITGTVKFADGTPLTSGQITFESATTNVVGPLDAEGRFSLFQFKPGDKVPPGEYRGAVMYDVSEQIPFSQKYLSFHTSGLTLTVEKGKPQVLDIVLEK